MLFDKKEDEDAQQGKQIIGFTKPKRFLFFKTKAKPIYSGSAAASDKNSFAEQVQQIGKRGGKPAQAAVPQGNVRKMNSFQMFITTTAARHKNLESALREQGVKESMYDFVKRMFVYSALLAIIVGLVVSYVMYTVGVTPILGMILAIAIFYAFFNRFIQYPIDRSKNIGRDVEKDIVFAVRDIVIGMRSGMPLFNAMTAVSTGYGAASKEFAKVVELVQLGMPIEEAIDETSTKSNSKTFKRIMLQASVSIKSGADLVGAMQSVLDEVSQERVIELRRYGQRLNALAMFYMLFGVIFPSMGIAVAAILTTFINIFTVDTSTLLFALVGIFFLQLIFMNIMRTSRPSFSL